MAWIIERRYQHVTDLLEGDIKSFKKLLTKEVSDEQMDEFENELVAKRNKLLVEYELSEDPSFLHKFFPTCLRVLLEVTQCRIS